MNNFRATHLPEPSLVFGGNNLSVDPKTGITLYGPYSSSPKQIRIGIIGDGKTIEQVKHLLNRYKNPLKLYGGNPQIPIFPGFSINSPFRCDFEIRESFCREITSKDFAELQKSKKHELISRAVELFCQHLQVLKEHENAPEVVICAPPNSIAQLCEDAISTVSPILKQLNYSPGQTHLFDHDDDLLESLHQAIRKEFGDNFHDYLKSRAMDVGIPTQFIRPDTLENYVTAASGKKQSETHFAWNLCTALYYKGQGQPWKLANAPDGTCFIGVSFYKEKKQLGNNMGACLAQVFPPEGDGIVLRGERFKWKQFEEPHLDAAAAQRLVERAISAYETEHRLKPKRVVIHKTSRFNEREKIGFQAGLKEVPKSDFVAITTDQKQLRFYRSGYHPIIRGTLITLPDQMRLLYTKAYIPFLGVYPGARIPIPLEVYHDAGDSPTDTVCSEILGLTKLNWNNADFTGRLPITLEFSKRVGKILRETLPGTQPQTRYRFYM
ncbi:hypothetical protein HY605_02340 [Candidatus Peregrinibacteria bacterium]|nr:hypothetical protein [Candidatus Peregrinibacteria bacterium]